CDRRPHPRAPASDEAVADLCPPLQRRPLRRRGGLSGREGGSGGGDALLGRGRGGAAVMKYVFVLVLLLVGGVAGVLGLNVGYRWFHNMTESPRIMPGERAFSMPVGSVPRGGELRLPKEEREVAALRRTPIPATPASVQKGGELFVIYCTPCHGSQGKGTRAVSTALGL